VFSNIPYEKGALFLRELEQRVGRDNFDQFLLAYFKHFSFQSITTDEFITYLDSTLLRDYADKLDKPRILQWIFEPGIPAGAPVPESNAFVIVQDALQEWLSGQTAAKDIKTDDWVVHQWLYFLNNMPDGLNVQQLQALDAAFEFTQGSNNEIVHVWLKMAIQHDYKAAYPRLESYLLTIGRNKLVKPLYRELVKTPEGKVFAKRVFEEAKVGYHPLTISANEAYVNDH